MTPLWDAVLRARAERKILSTGSCHKTDRIVTGLLQTTSATTHALKTICPGVMLPIYPNQPGTIECAIGRWYFRYRILNANTIEVFSIGPSLENRNHPMYRPPER